eukprot:TRINITY_DN31690_c0_g1_i1.p1 TRINITY_DN31690_c0_g1~~TRINITY_DN31690_c0_g1_i1.p1  ORF type:complete len:463 (+),score=101.34 TRINITY_DN31690_c0_g1_i1:104-1492(+)
MACWWEMAAVLAAFYFVIMEGVWALSGLGVVNYLRITACCGYVLWIMRHRLFNSLRRLCGYKPLKQVDDMDVGTTDGVKAAAYPACDTIVIDKLTIAKAPKPTRSASSAWWTSMACCGGRELAANDDTSPKKAAADVAITGVVRHSSVEDANFARKREELRRRLSDILGDMKSLRPVASPAEATKQLQKHKVLLQKEAALSAKEDAVITCLSYGGQFCMFSRFLRARAGDVDAAEKMIRKTFEYRREYGMNVVLCSAKLRDVWTPLRKLWPMAPVHFTADGSLATYCRLSHFLRFWTMGIDEGSIRTLYMAYMEKVVALQRERWLTTGAHRSVVPGEMPPMFEIFDFEGFSLSHISCLKGFRLMSRILSIGQDHYPENLRSAVFLNLPGFARKAYNAVASRTFDAHAMAKFTFATEEDLPRILQASHDEVQRIFRSVRPYGDGNGVRGKHDSVLGEIHLDIY